MRELYKGRWASFINNAGVRAIFSLNDYDSAHYWSEFMGQHVVDTHSQQKDVYGVVRSHAASEALRPLLTADELMFQFANRKPFAESPSEGRPPDTMLILQQGAHPLVTERVAYFHDALLQGLWNDPRTRGPHGARG